MGLFSSDKGPENGWWSADDCAEGPDFYKKEKKKKVKKVERRRHEEDDDDDEGEEYDWDGAGQVFGWLIGIGLFINLWWIIIPVGLIIWLLGKDS